MCSESTSKKEMGRIGDHQRPNRQTSPTRSEILKQTPIKTRPKDYYIMRNKLSVKLTGAPDSAMVGLVWVLQTKEKREVACLFCFPNDLERRIVSRRKLVLDFGFLLLVVLLHLFFFSKRKSRINVLQHLFVCTLDRKLVSRMACCWRVCKRKFSKETRTFVVDAAQ